MESVGHFQIALTAFVGLFIIYWWCILLVRNIFKTVQLMHRNKMIICLFVSRTTDDASSTSACRSDSFHQKQNSAMFGCDATVQESSRTDMDSHQLLFQKNLKEMRELLEKQHLNNLEVWYFHVIHCKMLLSVTDIFLNMIKMKVRLSSLYQLDNTGGYTVLCLINRLFLVKLYIFSSKKSEMFKHIYKNSFTNSSRLPVMLSFLSC